MKAQKSFVMTVDAWVSVVGMAPASPGFGKFPSASSMDNAPPSFTNSSTISSQQKSPVSSFAYTCVGEGERGERGERESDESWR